MASLNPDSNDLQHSLKNNKFLKILQPFQECIPKSSFNDSYQICVLLINLSRPTIIFDTMNMNHEKMVKPKDGSNILKFPVRKSFWMAEQ